MSGSTPSMNVQWNAQRRKYERGIDETVRRLKYAVQNQNHEVAESEAFQLYQLLDDYTELGHGEPLRDK